MTAGSNEQDEDNKPDNKSEVAGYLNKGNEDELEIFGYEEYLPYKVATWTCIFLSLGLLRLVFHWWPRFMLYSTHRPTSLERAEKLLIVDTYEEKYKSFFVKEVKRISYLTTGAENKKNEPPAPLASNCQNVDENNKTLKDLRKIEINLENGFKKDLSDLRVVWIKKLCYVWVNEKKSFLKLIGLDEGMSKSDIHSFDGYSEHQQAIKRIAYGWNEININIQTIPTLFILEVLNPFYFFQVFTLIVWMCEEYYYYSIAIVIMSVFGISSSVIQTHQNQKNLHKTIHSSDIVTVKREENLYEEVPSTHLVPGDVIVIPYNGCIMQCDAALLQGNCIVNESMLTGESVPVTKTALPENLENYSIKDNTHHTLFGGTKIIQTRYYNNEKVHAVVLRTGFQTTKGSLVRSILYPPPADFKFDQDSYKFIWVLAAIGTIGFIYTLVLKIQRGFGSFDIIIKGLDLFTIAIPPALPAAMTVGKMFALSRLKKKKISCINSRVINVSGSLNCVCFDKTGTLTEDGLDMWGVILAYGNKFEEPVQEIKKLPAGPMLCGMASCHSLTLINGLISGDPLDLKMFEFTEWIFEEPVIPDTLKYDLLAPTIVRPNNSEMHPEIGILHQFQFSSKLQRMSVITRKLGSKTLDIYCKGSPEMILSLSNPSTVPPTFFTELRKYTEQGYRVLGLGYKNIPTSSYHHLQRMSREEIETDLEFVGFIVLENRLKPQTVPTIETLKKAKIKIVMITGDNIQTAISVARESGIVEYNDTLIEMNVELEGTKTPTVSYNVLREMTKGIENGCSILDVDKQEHPFKLAVTGKDWALIRDYFPQLVTTLLLNGAIFARMSSDQKQQVVLELQQLGFYVAMCGDGANDCGALKAANVGISLSEAEASVASPFTSQDPNITCVPVVIKEGRAALTTSIGVFKFMVLYSLTEFMSTLILYYMDSNLTDFQFLFIDVALVVNFAFFFGRNEAYKGDLVPDTPLTSLLSISPFLSLILQTIAMFVFQIIAYHLVRMYKWYTPFRPSNENDYVSFENFAVFSVSQFQYITLAIAFSQGPPFRTPLYCNKIFLTSLLIMTAICFYITLHPANWLKSLLELRYPPDIDFPLIIIGMAILNFIVSMFFEKFIIEYLVLQKFGNKNGEIMKNFKNTSLNVAKDLTWPSLAKAPDKVNDIYITVNDSIPLENFKTRL